MQIMSDENLRLRPDSQGPIAPPYEIEVKVGSVWPWFSGGLAVKFRRWAADRNIVWRFRIDGKDDLFILFSDKEDALAFRLCFE